MFYINWNLCYGLVLYFDKKKKLFVSYKYGNIVSSVKVLREEH